MKYVCVFASLILVVLNFLTVSVYAENAETEKILNEYAEFYGDVFDDAAQGVDSSVSFTEIIPDFDSKSILTDLNSGTLSVTPDNLLRYPIKLLLGEAYSCAKLLAIVLALALLSSYLSNLSSGVAKESVAYSAFFACYTAMAAITATAFYQIAGCATEAIKSVSVFMKLIVPSVMALMMSGGAVVSVASLQPTVIAIVEIAVWLGEVLFIPAVMISAALNIVNSMSDSFKTDKMVKLINNGVKWGFSAMLIIFVGLSGIKSMAASGADGLAVKLSKFATSNMVPVVGGILSESVETVMGCSVIIKNSVGIFGIICIVLAIIRPIIRICATLIIFRLAAAVAEPISEERVTACVTGLADSISVLLSMVVAISVMFIIVITILLNAGSNAVILGR